MKGKLVVYCVGQTFKTQDRLRAASNLLRGDILCWCCPFFLCLEQLRLCHLCFWEQTWLVRELKRVFHICKPAGLLFIALYLRHWLINFKSLLPRVLPWKRHVAGFTISTVSWRLVGAVWSSGTSECRDYINILYKYAVWTVDGTKSSRVGL